MLVTGDGVPDDEAGPKAVVQRASMSAIHGHPSFMGFERHRQRGDGGGSGGGHETFALEVAEEAEQGRRAVERAVAAEEGGAGEELAPGLADEGGAHEARRVVRREAEEDLGGGVVDQIRRPRHGNGVNAVGRGDDLVWVGIGGTARETEREDRPSQASANRLLLQL